MEAAIAIVVASIAAAGTILGNAWIQSKSASIQRDLDKREEKKKVYAECLSSIGRMMRQAIERWETDPDSKPPDSKEAAELMPKMTNWAAPDVFERYFLFRMVLRSPASDIQVSDVKERIAELILSIRKDLEFEDLDWAKSGLNEALGAVFFGDVAPPAQNHQPPADGDG